MDWRLGACRACWVRAVRAGCRPCVLGACRACWVRYEGIAGFDSFCHGMHGICSKTFAHLKSPQPCLEGDLGSGYSGGTVDVEETLWRAATRGMHA